MLRARILQAVHELTKGDPGKSVSYAEIARQIDPGSDSHGRNAIYNRVVETVKDLIEGGSLRYLKPSLAGHPAFITINYQGCSLRPQVQSLF